MTDRDRLIKLFDEIDKDPAITCPHYKTDKTCDTCKYTINNFMCNHTERTVDYLLANGVIVPPVSVGQTVYNFCDVFGGFLPYVIQDFKVGFMGKYRPNYWYWEATSHAIETDELLDEIEFDLDDIGKTVFLTKEEAEEKLKELNDNC